MAKLWRAFIRGGWNSWAYEIGTCAFAAGLPLTIDCAIGGPFYTDVLQNWLLR